VTAEESEITLEWRGVLTDAEMVDLVSSYGGDAVAGWDSSGTCGGSISRLAASRRATPA